jgi:hypothetical protein
LHTLFIVDESVLGGSAMISFSLKLISLLSVLLLSLQPGFALKDDEKKALPKVTPILWQNPGNVRSRNLFYGCGAANRAPVPPFQFIEEDKSGESPKFKVSDARGVKWSVKLGPEAQAETVATRLVWAVGYFAEEAYYLDKVRIENLPRLSRGRQYVKGRGEVYGARFEPRREGIRKAGTWDWNKNPFAGTHELNGLKVVMILLNNYDARSENNKVLISNHRQISKALARYVVTDLGATLGKAGGLGGKRSKNDLEDFLSTRFVLGVEDGAVKFDYDTRPTKLGIVSVLYPPYYLGEVKKEKSMRGIPVEHARWIGSLLSQLSNAQLRDAFRAAGYEARTRDGYVLAIRRRIRQLTRL